nr:MarR family transcriptional regulator [Maritalea porphyrae]
MTQSNNTGLGELLRHLTDLLDRGSLDAYNNEGLDFRPRYTPIMRVLNEEPMSVSDLCAQLHITQGAVSQAVKLMEQDGLVARVPTTDSRSRSVVLTNKGKNLRSKLIEQWRRRTDAIWELEQEIQAPLRTILEDAIEALEDRGFADRLSQKYRGDE